MKRQLLGVAAILLSISTYAQDNPLWMRYCAISPDGTTIAFTYKGDIYTVPSTGGRASQITTNPAHDTKPIWSPDGKKIAFASDRMGSMDIFEVNKEGGIPKRLTTHSGNETPVAYKDAGHILFLANIMPTAEDAQFPSGQFQQVYEVNTEGGRPVLFSSMPMEDISINHTGNTLLYHDKKGYEDPWRKHHTSSITRDIWLCSLNGNRTFRKQTAFNGEDRTPVWASDDKSFYYLSEEKGSFNIFKRDIDGNTSKQITNHTKHPVRFLSAASNGTLCYGYDGEIYTVKEGAIPQKVQISIVTDKNDKDLIRQIKRSGATEISLSPDAKEIAFVLRGDVYVTSTEYSTTKQITNTPQQERDIHFSPDGRSIVYASERNGLWQIYQTSLAKKEEKQFAYATDIKEERLTNSDITSFQPQYSPDGKEVAFLENRTTIRVLNLKSKAVRTVMDGKYEYSYSDGDQWYQWSPDSKWILTNYIGIGGWNNKDVALVNASGNGEIHNLTESGYSDGNAKWVLDGKAMIWESDRAGFRSHGSWGAEADIYIMFFDLDAYDRFRMSKEELALLEDSEKKDKEKSEEKEKADHKKDKKKDSKRISGRTDKSSPMTGRKLQYHVGRILIGPRPSCFFNQDTFSLTISSIISLSQPHRFMIIRRMLGYITIQHFISSTIHPTIRVLIILHHHSSYPLRSNISFSVLHTFLQKENSYRTILPCHLTFLAEACQPDTIFLTRHLYLIIITDSFGTLGKRNSPIHILLSILGSCYRLQHIT